MVKSDPFLCDENHMFEKCHLTSKRYSQKVVNVLFF